MGIGQEDTEVVTRSERGQETGEFFPQVLDAVVVPIIRQTVYAKQCARLRKRGRTFIFAATSRTLHNVVLAGHVRPVHRDFPAGILGRLRQHGEFRAESSGCQTPQALGSRHAPLPVAAPHVGMDRPVGGGHHAPSLLDNLAGHAQAVILDFQPGLAWNLTGTERQFNVVGEGVVGVLNEFHDGSHIIGHQFLSQRGEDTRMQAHGHRFRHPVFGTHKTNCPP